MKEPGMDRSGFDAAVRAHQPYLLSLAKALLRRGGLPGAQPEDLLQEVWASLWREEGRTLLALPPQERKAYLAACVLNAARMQVRGDARRRAREARHAAPMLPAGLPGEGADLETALGALEEDDQLLLRWIYWEGLPQASAGRLLGLSPGAVGVRLHRARSRLRAFLERRSGNPVRETPPTAF